MLLAEGLAHKVLPRLLHRRAVEVQRAHLVNAVKRPHQIGALLRRVQQRQLPAEHQGIGMIVHGQRSGGQAEAVGDLPGLLQQSAVPEMHAVKKTKGKHTGLIHR